MENNALASKNPLVEKNLSEIEETKQTIKRKSRNIVISIITAFVSGIILSLLIVLSNKLSENLSLIAIIPACIFGIIAFLTAMNAIRSVFKLFNLFFVLSDLKGISQNTLEIPAKIKVFWDETSFTSPPMKIYYNPYVGEMGQVVATMSNAGFVQLDVLSKSNIIVLSKKNGLIGSRVTLSNAVAGANGEIYIRNGVFDNNSLVWK